MKKEYIIGGLSLIGGIALIAYLLKPKTPRRNSEGFFGMTGRPSQNCSWCKTRGGTLYHTGSDRNCNGTDRCVSRYALTIIR